MELAQVQFLILLICLTSLNAREVVFISGGRDTETLTEVLDMDGDCSYELPSLPSPGRRYHSGHFINDQVLLCGGTDSSTVRSCIQSSNLEAGIWSNYSQMSDGRWGHSGTTIGDLVFIAGGDPTGRSTELLSSGIWEKVASVPYSVDVGSCAVQTGDKTIVLTGGRWANNKAIEFNIETRSWRQLPDMSVRREYHGCGVLRIGESLKLVLAGGWGLGTALKSASVFDLKTEIWEELPDMSVERYAPKIVNVGEHFLVLGGLDKDRNSLDSIEELQNDLTWEVVKKKMKNPRFYFSAVTISENSVCSYAKSAVKEKTKTAEKDLELPSQHESVILISGGRNVERSVEVMDLHGHCSGRLKSLPEPGRRYHTGHFINNNVLLCGGTEASTVKSCSQSQDPASGVWTEHSNTTANRWGHSGTSTGTKAFLLGGDGTGRSVDVLTDKWRVGTPSSYSRGMGSCAVAAGEDSVLVTGGRWASKQTAEYKIETSQWRELPDMGIRREYHGCGITWIHGRRKLVVAGGLGDEGPLKSVEMMDLETEVWETVGDMNMVRYAPQMVSFKDQLVVLGGLDINRQGTNTGEQLSPDLSWDLLGTTMSESRYYFSAIPVPAKFICPTGKIHTEL